MSGVVCRLGWKVAGLVLALTIAPLATRGAAIDPNHLIYSEALEPGWQNASDGTVDFAAKERVYRRRRAITFTTTAGGQAFRLRTTHPIDTSAYTLLSFFAVTIHRRLLWFTVPSQAVQILPLFLAAQAVSLVVHLIAGGMFPGWELILAPVFQALLWPVATWLLLAPQRRAPDPDENRPQQPAQLDETLTAYQPTPLGPTLPALLTSGGTLLAVSSPWPVGFIFLVQLNYALAPNIPGLRRI